MPLARPRRQSEVFDIAIVAVVTKALGAFLVLVIILLPFYRSDPANAPAVNIMRDHLESSRRAIEAVQKDLTEGVDAKELAARVEQLKRGIDHAQGYVQGLRNNLDQSSGQIKRIEAELAEALAKAEQAQLEADRARQQLVGLQATTDSLRQNSQRLQNQVDDLQRRLQAELAVAQQLRDRNSTLERERDRAKQDAIAHQQQLQRVQQERDSLARSANRNLDASIVMRWFSIGVIMPECSDIKFTLYVRWDGSLVNAGSGINMPNREFEAVDPTKRTTLLGHKYFDLGARHEEGALSDSSLREAGISALGKTQIKLFNAVSSLEGQYSVYIAPADPSALTGRRCPIYPYFLSWAGATLGNRIVLTQDQPFAWLRRFRINRDGTNTLAIPPSEDDKFRDDLASFSRNQTQRLCSERSICGKEDAHRYALRTGGRSSQP